MRGLALGSLAMWLTVLAASAQATPASSPTAAYSSARRIWKAAACHDAAEQSGKGGLWWRAASELDRARREPSGFRAAAGRLRNIAVLPETEATTRQMQEGNSDVRYLDAFFHTPGWYVTLPKTCRQT